MKKISVVIPTFNEEKNINSMYEAVKEIFNTKLQKYEMEIVIIDNYSIDGTRNIIKDICKKDMAVKAIFNSRNFGPFNSPFYAMCQATGDAVILINADFQEPVELIASFVKEWELGGYQVVCGIRRKSRENKLKYFFRSLYYKVLRKLSDFEQIPNFTGFGLYDRSVINILKRQADPIPFIRSMVAEFGFSRKEIVYDQNPRKNGRSSFNLYRYYDAAMIGITAYTKIGMRLATFLGFFCSVVSALIAILYFVWKLLYWDKFPAGITPAIIGVFFIGSVQIFFIGILGEYILSINTRLMNRPLVVEECRINFEADNEMQSNE